MLDFLQIWNNQKRKQLPDKEFLEEFVLAFYEIFFNEMASIKNNKSQYIATTTSFANLIGVAVQDIILKTDAEIPSKFSKYADLFYEYDRAVEQLKKPISFLDINEYFNSIGAYVFHKKPVINPHTNNVLGVLYYVEQYKVTNLLNMLRKMHNPKSKIDHVGRPVKLGTKQSEVLFCILLGIKGDKVIAHFINEIKGSCYTQQTVSNAVKELYKKFDTNDRYSLLQQAIAQNFHLQIPISLVKYGRYVLERSVIDII